MFYVFFTTLYIVVARVLDIQHVVFPKVSKTFVVSSSLTAPAKII